MFVTADYCDLINCSYLTFVLIIFDNIPHCFFIYVVYQVGMMLYSSQKKIKKGLMLYVSQPWKMTINKLHFWWPIFLVCLYFFFFFVFVFILIWEWTFECQVAASMRKDVDAQIPNYPNLPSKLLCLLHNVTLHVGLTSFNINF